MKLVALTFGAAALSSEVANSLQNQIAVARTLDPETFAQVDALWAKLPELDRAKRGRFVPLSRTFKAMGPSVVWPLLDRLVFDGEVRGDLTDSAWYAWRLAVVEALGLLRDTHAEPVLHALLGTAQDDERLMTDVVRAYARFDTDDVAFTLVALSQGEGAWARAALTGMGHCRRVVVAQRLADALASGPEPELADAIAGSLADVGSVSPWEILAKQGRTDGLEVRGVATRALVKAFAYADPISRKRLTTSILIVDHPETLQLIDQLAPSAKGSDVAAVAELRRRVVNSPMRKAY
jgi:hypothetical protein